MVYWKGKKRCSSTTGRVRSTVLNSFVITVEPHLDLSVSSLPPFLQYSLSKVQQFVLKIHPVFAHRLILILLVSSLEITSLRT